jgi:hypothetical protein
MARTKSGTKPRTRVKRVNFFQKYKGKPRFTMDDTAHGFYVNDAKTGITRYYPDNEKNSGRIIKSRSGKNW